MVAAVRDVAAYMCKWYPRPADLSKARLTKMVYLADWKSALDNRRQMTGITWRFNHYGPYVDDVVDAVAGDPDFELVVTENRYGSEKGLVVLRNPDTGYPSLGPDDLPVLDHVIAKTAALYWDDFIRVVYSTYPVLSQPRYTQLDLVSLAGRYRTERQALDLTGPTTS